MQTSSLTEKDLFVGNVLYMESHIFDNEFSFNIGIIVKVVKYHDIKFYIKWLRPTPTPRNPFAGILDIFSLSEIGSYDHTSSFTILPLSSLMVEKNERI